MSEPRLTLLILGGYGTFGGRLAELLCGEPALSLIIAGRSQAKAEAFCAGLPPGAHRRAIALDRETDLDRQLSELKPHILIDATGPFQVYGDDPYRAVRAAITAGVHYLDLADSPAFVRGIAEFDDAAKEKGLAILSGVSSFPVLTAAVVRHLAHDLKSVDSIVGGIAPSPYAGYGFNVIRAIAEYAGKPVALRRGGRPVVGYALAEVHRYTIAPPGLVPLSPIEFSLVDVPDLQLLTDLWPEVKTVWMGAGPVPALLHRLIRLLAGMVARGVIPSLRPLAPLMFHTVNTLRWGEPRGGMFVEIDGSNAKGNNERRSWHLLAEGTDGPYIPSMAIAAIVRKWLFGLCPVPGARAATQELELKDYLPLFERRRIYCGQRRVAESDERGLYERLLGDAYDSLPASLRVVHGRTPYLRISGRASIVRGRGPLARLVARIFRLPGAAADVPVAVTFERTPTTEKWTRDFNGRVFSTSLFAGRNRFERLLCERFGPFVFGMAPIVNRDRLSLVVRRWSAFGVALPRALAPLGNTYEIERNGRFNFHVEIKVPCVGLVVRYEGSLENGTDARG